MRILHIWAALIGMIGICVSGVAGAQTKFDFGKQEFMTRCASCHGAAGKGDGVLRGYLTKSPTDLTAMSKNNHGIFPYQYVSEVIDGRHTIPLHGGDMPIWGDVYKAQAGQQFQDWPYQLDREAYVRARIAALADYLNRIQEK